MLFSLREFQCALDVLREAMVSPDYSITHLSGINPHGNVELDEALEETGVADTKAHGSLRTAGDLKNISYTVGGLRSVCIWLTESVCKVRLEWV